VDDLQADFLFVGPPAPPKPPKAPKPRTRKPVAASPALPMDVPSERAPGSLGGGSTTPPAEGTAIDNDANVTAQEPEAVSVQQASPPQPPSIDDAMATFEAHEAPLVSESVPGAPAAEVEHPSEVVAGPGNAPAPEPAERIPREEIAEAYRDAEKSGQKVIDVLESRLAIPAPIFVARLGATLDLDVVSMDALHALEPDYAALPFAQAALRECVALRDRAGTLLAVIGDPFDPALRAWAELAIAGDFEWRLAHPADLRAYLSQREESMRAMDAVLGDREGKAAGASEDVELLSIASISEGDSPVVKLVSSTIYDALRANTSDIHIETGPSGLTIKYRLDGVLATLGTVQGSDMAEQVLSRIKVMAELDISERRVPQDGRFKVLVKGRAVDFRVSIMPSIHGEDAVLRILDKHTLTGEQKALRLDSLGFDAPVMARIRSLARKPYGMLLVTGPTGSGKSTSLYAALSEINSGQDKIITIEDPVEYQLNGVLQIPVNEKKGLTFSRGLRSILRHDPDIILVGEMRDPETAQIAVQAALTGHLVFTTVHANNVFDVISRSIHMGIEPYAFVSAVNGIVAQRLMRKTCPHCAVDQPPDDELLAASGLTRAQVKDFVFRVGRGCGACRGTGYSGRKAIAEILLVNDEIREMILRAEPVRKLREAAAANGTRTLRESALDCVRAGETTLQEINRVTFVA
jgi:general secretion pathway protein E